MRVLQLVQQPALRGAEVFAAQLGSALTRRGHCLRTVYLYPCNDKVALPLAAQDSVLGITKDSWLEKIPGIQPRMARRLYREIRRYAPDIVQLNGARTVKYGVICRSLGSCRARFVYRNIGDLRHWLRDPLRRRCYRALLQHLDGIVAISRDAADYVRALVGDGVLIEEISNGIDTVLLEQGDVPASIRAARNVAPNELILAYVGRLSDEKRVDRAMCVLREVRASGVAAHLWIVGEGPARQALEDHAAQLGISPFVRFEGATSAIGPILRAASCALLLSETEGIPAVVLEAAALGVPVVASNVGGVSGTLIHGTTGFLVEPGDVRSAAQAVLTLARSPETWGRMSRAARQHAKPFDINCIAARYEAFYKRVMPNDAVQATPWPDRAAGVSAAANATS